MVEGATDGIAILTIGYGNRTIEDFLQLLARFQIEYLVDVRTSPQSTAWPDYAADSLRTRLDECGIRYVYMGDVLGGRPQDPTCYVNGRVDYLRCRRLDSFQAGIARLRKALQEKHRLALMCAEIRPEECHRAKLIGEELAAQDIAVRHIDETGELRDHAEVIARLDDGQPGLFEPDVGLTMSRKQYRQGAVRRKGAS